MGSPTTRRHLVAAVAAVTALAAGSVAATTLLTTDEDGDRAPAATSEYLPGRAADVYLPRDASTAPVVVLVPGGGWRTADRGGLAPLARALADGGVVAVTISYRAADDGGRFPQPAGDVLCAVDFAVDHVRRSGLVPGPVVVAGHSAGAHLAALAALAPERFRAGCPYPAARIQGLVGIAGVYDVTSLPEVAEPLFGVPLSQDPARWREGNPLTWIEGSAERRPTDLRVLLLHGTGDTLVPPSTTTGFAAALKNAGVPVTVLLPDGLDHHQVYAADVAADPLLSWLRGRDGEPARPDRRMPP